MHKVNYLSPNWLIKEAVNRQVRRHLPLMGGTVYDLGCGKKPYQKDIEAYASNYIGVDWTNTLHGQHADINADLNRKIPIADSTANAIVSFEVLEHLTHPTIMLSEANRILIPGGLLFLSVPFQWLIHEAPWDYFRYTAYGLKYILETAGFRDIEITPTTGFWTTWILKFNYFFCRLIAKLPKLIRRPIQVALIPLWLFDQLLAKALDLIYFDDLETSGYFISARK